jgi:hypothetical protein
MATILIVGSRKGYDATEFRDACRAIGAALARAGHTIVASGCGDEDAETWVLDGANSAETSDRKTRVIPFTPAVPGIQDVLTQAPDVSARWAGLLFLPAFKTKGPWAVGQAVALIRSDAALLIGGGVLTANVGSLALELEKPYYAVGALGGAAQTLAAEDLAKHRNMGMPSEIVEPAPNSSEFGKSVVKACEFLIRQRKEKTALRDSVILLLLTVLILGGLIGFLFRHDLFGNEPRLLYATCLGAFSGVILAFLIGHVIRREALSVSAVLGQMALGCFLGVLYGFFTVHAGSFYAVKVEKLTSEEVESLARNMAFVGIGVGALLGPASKQVLEELGRAAHLKAE